MDYLYFKLDLLKPNHYPALTGMYYLTEHRYVIVGCVVWLVVVGSDLPLLLTLFESNLTLLVFEIFKCFVFIIVDFSDFKFYYLITDLKLVLTITSTKHFYMNSLIYYTNVIFFQKS